MKIITKGGLFLLLFGILLTYLHYYLNFPLIPFGYFIMIGCGLFLIAFAHFYQKKRRKEAAAIYLKFADSPGDDVDL